MQGNGNDQVEAHPGESGIFHGFGEHLRERMTEVSLMAVLEFVDKPADKSATAISGDRGIEMENSMGAIRAMERLRDCAEEWF
jgi:hypothetical protein